MIRQGISLISALIAVLPALPVAAAGSFTLPDGCTVFATVQMRDCQLSQHYRCDFDPEGDQWALYADSEGPYYVGRTDYETRWVESFGLYDGSHETLAQETDPASFTTLTTTGRDDFDFTTTDPVNGTRRYSGWDQLTGERVTIDGISLERTRFDLTARDGAGAVLFRRSGNQLIHRDWRLFWGDTERFENADGEVFDTVASPVTISGPGQPGYLATKPQYDCDMMMTGWRP